MLSGSSIPFTRLPIIEILEPIVLVSSNVTYSNSNSILMT